MAQDPFGRMLTSWDLSMRARNLSPKTRAIYTAGARALAAHLTATGVPSYEAAGKRDLEGWVAAMLDTHSAGYASNKYRAAQQLYRWLAEEAEIDVSPFTRMTPPKVAENLVPVMSREQIRALLKGCSGNDFTSRRDYAICRLFLASGPRLAELTNLTLPDLDLGNRVAVVTGKGSRSRLVRFDAETARAIDRYLRCRDRDPRSQATEALWLRERGRTPLTTHGVYQVITRRALAVGVRLHPHVFRHTFSHLFLANGGAEGDLMELNGWQSAQMVRRYGASARGERARTSYDRVAPLDGL